MHLLLKAIPAYGRKYDTVEAMLAAWDEGKDFQLWKGGPCFSSRDLPQLIERGLVELKLFDLRTLVGLQFDIAPDGTVSVSGMDQETECYLRPIRKDVPGKAGGLH